MRLFALVIALAPSLVAAAKLPPHLAAMPAGVVSVGPAPRLAVATGVAKPGERLGLWLPGGVRAFEVDSVQRVADGVESRAGRLEGGGHAMLTLGRDGGFARVVDGATVWLLEVRDGATYAVRAGVGGLALAAIDDGAVELSAEAIAAAPASARSRTPTRKAADGFTTIDLLQTYDTDFAARYPGALLDARLAHLAALANQAFVDSGIKTVLRVVGKRPVTGLLDGDIASNLADMSGALQDDAYFGDLRLLRIRSDLGADLISFHRIHDMYQRGACGIAYFPSRILDTTSVSVTVDGGSLGSVCDDLVFAHEIGHNLGARHQVETDGSGAIGHAFVRRGAFHTILGSFATGDPDRNMVLPFFSNPRMACGGTACGRFDISDNHSAMSDNVGYVAGYRGVKVSGSVTVPAQSDPDSDGDGIRDRLDAFPFDPARNADRDQDGVADGDDAFPDNGTEQHDHDGGGQGDVADVDDDNDGVGDLLDDLPLDPRDSVDTDNDGIGDSQDEFPAEPREDRDTDTDGLGDRADLDDDADGTIDLGTGASLAESELLVADGASDRILRFRGSDMAAIGTLIALGVGEVTQRSEMAHAPSGELWFVAGSSLLRLDRLRSELRVMVNAYADTQVGSGFPLSPVMIGSDIVAFGELPTSRIFTSNRWQAELTPFALGSSERMNLVPMPDGRMVGVDGNSGNLTRLRYDSAAPGRLVREISTGSGLTGLRRPISGGVAADGSLYVVETFNNTIRRLDATGSFAPVAGFSAAYAAHAVTVGPDGAVYVGLVGGGVRKLDPLTGADLGLVVGTGAVAEPLALKWVPRVIDLDLSARAPAPAPSGADAGTTPAVGGVTPVPPPSPLAPCLTNCGGGGGGGGGGSGSGGGGGAFDLALLASLAALALFGAAWSRRRRVITTS